MLEMFRVCNCNNKRTVRRIDMTDGSAIAFSINAHNKEMYVVANTEGQYYNINCPLCNTYTTILVTTNPDDKPMHPVKRN
jgi:hypothetical protein